MIAPYWISQEATNKLGAYNDGWFNIPNGWVADAPCIVVLKCVGATGREDDSHLSLNDFIVSEWHQEGGWGYTHNCVCPRGVRVNYSTRHSVAYFKAKRLQ